MKVYELMVIVNGALDEEAYKKSVTDIEKLIKAKKGTVTALDEWGKRKLAYPILKQDFGYYLVWRLTSTEASTPADLQASLKIHDAVLRSMMTLANTKKKVVKTEDSEAKATKPAKTTQTAPQEPAEAVAVKE